MRKRVLGTLKVLGTVLEQLSKELSPEEAERLIPREVCKLYNNIPDFYFIGCSPDFVIHVCVAALL